MNFNFGQYVRSSDMDYTEQITLSNFINSNNKTFIYNEMNLKTPDTYCITLKLPSCLQTVNGTLFIKETESSPEIAFLNFTIPSVSNNLSNRSYFSSLWTLYKLVMEARLSPIAIGRYIQIMSQPDEGEIIEYTKNMEDKVSFTHDGTIYTFSSFRRVGNIYDYNGFTAIQSTLIKKVLTIRGNKTYEVLGVSFDSEYLGWGLQIEKVKELLGNSNYIPHSELKHLGIQGKSGMRYCINGNELRLTSRGVEEFFVREENPIYSVKVIPDDNFFLIDYEYIR